MTDVVALPAWLVGVSDDGGSIAAVHGGGADACHNRPCRLWRT